MIPCLQIKKNLILGSISDTPESFLLRIITSVPKPHSNQKSTFEVQFRQSKKSRPPKTSASRTKFCKVRPASASNPNPVPLPQIFFQETNGGQKLSSLLRGPWAPSSALSTYHHPPIHPNHHSHIRPCSCTPKNQQAGTFPIIHTSCPFPVTQHSESGFYPPQNCTHTAGKFSSTVQGAASHSRPFGGPNPASAPSTQCSSSFRNLKAPKIRARPNKACYPQNADLSLHQPVREACKVCKGHAAFFLVPAIGLDLSPGPELLLHASFRFKLAGWLGDVVSPLQPCGFVFSRISGIGSCTSIQHFFTCPSLIAFFFCWPSFSPRVEKSRRLVVRLKQLIRSPKPSYVALSLPYAAF